MFLIVKPHKRYCNGQCALLNKKGLDAIAVQAETTSINEMRIEDIFYTGILRMKANFTKIIDFDRTLTTLYGGQLQAGLGLVFTNNHAGGSSFSNNLVFKCLKQQTFKFS